MAFAYTGPSITHTITNCTNGHMDPIFYHIEAKILKENIKDISDTAQALGSFIRLQITHHYDKDYQLVRIQLGSRKDVAWLMLKYPTAVYGEMHVA